MKYEKSLKTDFSHYFRQYSIFGIFYCMTELARTRTCALTIVSHVTSSLKET